MLTFKEVKSRCKIDGFQCHHLIPVEIVERRAFAAFFAMVRAQGFDPNDFSTNGMHLPCNEEQAAVFRLPLHRGAHPRYNELVAERIFELTDLTSTEAYTGLRRLQAGLISGLRSSQLAYALRARDLLNQGVNFRRLDAEVEMLWSKTGHGLES